MLSSRRVPHPPPHPAVAWLLRDGRTKRPAGIDGSPVAGLGLVGLLVALAIIGFVVHTFFFTIYRVRQDGMFPSLPAGTLFLGQRKPHITQIERGDLVVFEHMRQGQDERLVWRVIALPGETVAMEGTSVWVNRERLVHELVSDTIDNIIVRETNRDKTYEVAYDKHSSHPALPLHVKVAADHFFVLGDNRHEALDSTYLGGIPFDEIIARKF
jgi:signal peptidase I